MKNSKLLLLAPLAFQSAMAGEVTGGWQFQLTPYLWLPTISGKLNYDLPSNNNNGGSARVDVGPTDWLDLLNGAFLLQGEARKERFLIFSDVIYLGLESDDDRVVSVLSGTGDRLPVDASTNLNTRTDIDGFAVTLAGGYNLLKDARSSLDVFAGTRYFSIEAKTSWNLSVDVELPGGGSVLDRQGSVDSDQEFWDVLVGTKGATNIGNGNWSLNYYLDVGTGDADLTWQALTGASYAFGWGGLMISYRHLEYDLGSQGLMQDFSFSGPMFGARFSF